MPISIQVGSYDASGDWVPFDTVEVENEGVVKGKEAAEKKVKEETPKWSGANYIRMYVEDETEPYKASFPNGRNAVWDR